MFAPDLMTAAADQIVPPININLAKTTGLDDHESISFEAERGIERSTVKEGLLHVPATHTSRLYEWPRIAREHLDEANSNPSRPDDSQNRGFVALEGDQPASSQRAPTTPPAIVHPVWEPWSEIALHYPGQSYLSDLIEEGPGFQQLLSYKHNIDELTEDVHQFTEQLDELLVAVQYHSQPPSTGNDYPYQESELSDDSRPPSPNSFSSGSPMASVINPTPRIGRRKGPLSEDIRKNAKAVRQKRSCFRCFIMKERCFLDELSVQDGICKKCRTLLNNYRTWGLTCTQRGFDQRGNFMVPKVLSLQLTARQVSAFIKDNVESVVPNSSIKLSLTMGFGEPLLLNAIEVVPRGQGATRMLGFGLSGSGLSTPEVLDNPPILPFLNDRHAIERHINHWLDSMIRESNTELPGHFFPEDNEQWQKEMLAIICQYHWRCLPNLEATGQGPYQTLRWALKLIVLNHIMCHCFFVPDDEIDALSRQLRYYRLDQSAKCVCPRLANKVIKSILLPMLYMTIDRVMCGLQKILRSRGDEEVLWDIAFCVVFLCLIVVGKTQVSLVERLTARLPDANVSYATADIKEMESELSTHLISMFHHRFGTMKTGKGRGYTYNPLATDSSDRPHVVSRLAELIRSATAAYGTCPEVYLFDLLIMLQVMSSTGKPNCRGLIWRG
jgi:hypothetical protein